MIINQHATSSSLNLCVIFLERALGSNERPVRIQQLRFEQAGYSEWDKPEDLGREDHSYMVKFVFKPDQALRLGSVS